MAPNPVLCERLRGDRVESRHRGVWAIADSSGTVIDSAGDPRTPVFARSATKSFQAVPLITSGAADALGVGPEGLAIALASHSGEPQHVEVASAVLEKIGLAEDDLQCGPAEPFFLEADKRRLINCCSGKHAGFLAVAVHAGQKPDTYLDRTGEVQKQVYASVLGLTSVAEDDVFVAIDGCSAPTFQLPIAALATGISRVANPACLAPEISAACTRLIDAATMHPELVGGSVDRFDTDVIRATNGRLFSKIGAEGVLLVGVRGSDAGFAIKIDDGNYRGFHAIALHTLHRHGWLSDEELASLDQWASLEIKNAAGLVTGAINLSS